MNRGGRNRELKIDHSVRNDLAPKWQIEDLNPARLSLKHISTRYHTI